MTDAELQEIADKAFRDWEKNRKKGEIVSNKDMLAILIGVTIGGIITNHFEKSSLRRRIEKLEAKVEEK